MASFHYGVFLFVCFCAIEADYVITRIGELSYVFAEEKQPQYFPNTNLSVYKAFFRIKMKSKNPIAESYLETPSSRIERRYGSYTAEAEFDVVTAKSGTKELKNTFVTKMTALPYTLHFEIMFGMTNALSKNNKHKKMFIDSRKGVINIPKKLNQRRIVVDENTKLKFGKIIAYMVLFAYRCGENLNCTKKCVSTPRYDCALNGSKICKHPWKNPLKNCTETDCNREPCNSKGCFTNNKCVCDKNYDGAKCDIMKPCSIRSKCLNGGSCIDINTNTSRCNCPHAYWGDKCETKMWHCIMSDSKACSKAGVAGTCIIKGNKTFCKCGKGVEGSECEKDINECTLTKYIIGESPCRNGGTCVNLNGTYKCKCLNPWLGDKCEVCKNPIIVGNGCEATIRCKWYGYALGAAITMYAFALLLSIVFIRNALVTK